MLGQRQLEGCFCAHKLLLYVVLTHVLLPTGTTKHPSKLPQKGTDLTIAAFAPKFRLKNANRHSHSSDRYCDRPTRNAVRHLLAIKVRAIRLRHSHTCSTQHQCPRQQNSQCCCRRRRLLTPAAGLCAEQMKLVSDPGSPKSFPALYQTGTPAPATVCPHLLLSRAQTSAHAHPAGVASTPRHQLQGQVPNCCLARGVRTTVQQVVDLSWVATQRSAVQRRGPIQQRLCYCHKVLIRCALHTLRWLLLLLLLLLCLLAS
jgi:hypothetical protein